MKQAEQPGKAPQQPESPQLRAIATLGDPRPPQVNPAHYDKHGGKLDHGGKSAKSESTATRQGGESSTGPPFLTLAQRAAAGLHRRGHPGTQRNAARSEHGE